MTDSVYGEYNNPKWIPKTGLILQSMLGLLDSLTPDEKADPLVIDTNRDLFTYQRLNHIQEHGPSNEDVLWLEDEARISKELVETRFGKEISKIRKQHNLETPSAPESL